MICVVLCGQHQTTCGAMNKMFHSSKSPIPFRCTPTKGCEGFSCNAEISGSTTIKIFTMVMFSPCKKSVHVSSYSNINREPLIQTTLSHSGDVQLSPEFFGEFSIKFTPIYGGIHFGVS